jgi:hypothetical protein
MVSTSSRGFILVDIVNGLDVTEFSAQYVVDVVMCYC